VSLVDLNGSVGPAFQLRETSQPTNHGTGWHQPTNQPTNQPTKQPPPPNSGESIRTGFMLAQGGEFAFVLLSLAENLSILPSELNQLLIIVVVLSMALTPGLAELGKRIAVEADRRWPEAPAAAAAATAATTGGGAYGGGGGGAAGAAEEGEGLVGGGVLSSKVRRVTRQSGST
jgi:hypothetical protein